MADQKHTIEVELIADAKKLRNAIKEARSSTQQMGGMADRMKKAGIKGHKDLAKITNKLKKGDKKGYAFSIREEKKLEKAMLKRIRAMRQMQRQQKNNRKEIEREARALAKLERQHRKLRSSRHKAGIFTGRERMGRAMKGQKQVTGSGLAGAANMIGGLAMGAISAIGGALIGMVTSQLSDAYATRQQYGRAYGGLIGQGGRRRDLERARGRGQRFGFGGIETATQARGVARQTGQIGAVTTAQALARSTGADVMEAGSFMGQLTRLGQGFGGKAGKGGKKELVNVLAMGFESGLDRARMPEFMQSVGTLAERAGAATAGDVDVGSISRIMALMGKGGSGLQGARGSRVLGRLDQAVKGPGGGEAGQALMLQAFGFGKPGGQTSYYDALRRQEQGVLGEGGAENLRALFSETKSQYGGGEAQILALRNMTGLTIDQLEAMREVVESGDDQESQMERLKELAAESKSIEEQGLDAMRKGFGDTVKRVAQLENRLIGMGEALKEPVERIQNVINRLIDRFFPVIVEALERIASFLEEIFRFIQDWAGDDVVNSGEDGAKARYDNAKKQIPILLAQYRSNQIGRDEFHKRRAEIIGKLQGASMRMFRDRGVGTAMGEGLEQVGADMWRALGGIADETGEEYRRRQQRENTALITGLMGEGDDRLGGSEGREAIQAYMQQELNARQRRRIEQAEWPAQEQMFLRGGRHYEDYVRFLEAHSQQYSETLQMIRDTNALVQDMARENNEGGANRARRSGARADTTGGVQGR